MEQTPRVKDPYIMRKLFRDTMFTMLIAEVSNALAAIIDAILTGRFLGPTALAACGIGGPYFSIATIFSGILMVGCTALCTRAVGKGDTKETSRVFTLTVTLGVVLSVLLAVFGTIFAGAFATLFGARGASAALHETTQAYLRGLFPSAPAFILVMVLTPILQLDGDPVRPKIASLVIAVVDIAGDLLNIFVFHGGMFGIAMASTVSQFTGLVVLASHFLKKSSLFRFSLREVKISMAPILMRDGLPRAICMFCRALLPILMNALALKLVGDMAVTALSAQINSSFLVGALGWGIGGAMLIVGGMAAGEQDVFGLETVVRSALREILIGVVCLAAVVFAASPLLTVLFIARTEGAYQMGVHAIRCYAICLPFLAFNVSASNYFQATSRPAGAYLINIGIEVACTAAMAYLLTPRFGIMGLWAAYPAGQALLTVLILLRAVLGRDKNRSGFASFLMLRPDFGVSEEDCIDCSVRSIDDVVSLSRDVVSFCEAHDIDTRQTNHLALCIEEMAGNVIEHGFNDGMPHHLDGRVLIKNGEIVLRLRDDCRQFDLREKAESWSLDPEHPEENIGIRLVIRMAKDIAYTNTMKTNNLIITI